MVEERIALIAARTQAKKSQDDLAKAVGCSQQYISMIEAGTRTPGLQVAKRIADEVGQPVDVLFPDLVASVRALINNISLSPSS